MPCQLGAHAVTLIEWQTRFREAAPMQNNQMQKSQSSVTVGGHSCSQPMTCAEMVC